MRRVTSILAAALIAGGAFASDFGDGSDGVVVISSSSDFDEAYATVLTSGTSPGVTTQLDYSSLGGGNFNIGDHIMLFGIDMSQSGLYEFNTVSNDELIGSFRRVTLQTPVRYSYFGARAVRVIEATDFTVNAGVDFRTLGDRPYVLAVKATNSITIEGNIIGSARGLAGGHTASAQNGFAPNFTGGGGGAGMDETIPSGGGGGGHANAGADGQDTISMAMNIDGGAGGSAYGEISFEDYLFTGAGGGSGGAGLVGQNTMGGGSGAIIFLAAPTITINGTIVSDGGDGQDGSGSVVSTNAGAGGGAGGSIWLRANTFLGTGSISALGGAGGAAGTGTTTTGSGGAGGDGRLQVDGTLAGSITTNAGSFFNGPSPAASVPAWDVY